MGWVFIAQVGASAALAWLIFVAADLDHGDRFRPANTRHRRQGISPAFLQRMAISQAAALLFVVGAVVTLGFGLAGIYWLAPAIICSYFIALLDAWMLLVEINR